MMCPVFTTNFLLKVSFVNQVETFYLLQNSYELAIIYSSLFLVVPFIPKVHEASQFPKLRDTPLAGLHR